MQCRIHRSSRDQIDVDFHVSAAMIITIQTGDHQSAVELKRQFDELPDLHHQLLFLQEQVRAQTGWVIA